uniref:Mitochondrial cardiolipin hydrolase n=1 Tax=Pundamilia nyererei TaxID=303518 RepID=A0A3B4EWK3_9CICH
MWSKRAGFNAVTFRLLTIPLYFTGPLGPHLSIFKGVALKGSVSLPSSCLSTLCSLGICVRCDVSAVHMHHKFAVVDGRTLITGSLNWTLTAVQSNMENIIITEEPDLVQPFVKEFCRLWGLNDSAQYLSSVTD